MKGLRVEREMDANITCHKTAFQDDGVSRLACAEIVENNVCPADFLTAGLGSMHSSPIIITVLV